MSVAYLGIGTNLGDKEDNLRFALENIEGQIGKIISCSVPYASEAWGFESENSFLNIGIKPIIKLGLETFDYDLREKVLVKGIEEKNPEVIANYFDEINLLQGISGQTKESMISDIETGLKYFSRICVNIMVENQMPIKPDKKVIEQFVEYVYPLYKDNDRVDILLNNTDFGVG